LNKGVFLEKNTQKSPYFEEIKLEVAIFRQSVPVGRQTMQEKIPLSCPMFFWDFFLFVAKLPIIHRKMQKKW
jgi:hypothetical protein